MPPSHQGYPGCGAVGGGHRADYAMDTKYLPYRHKVVIGVSKTHVWFDAGGGRMGRDGPGRIRGGATATGLGVNNSRSEGGWGT